MTIRSTTLLLLACVAWACDICAGATPDKPRLRRPVGLVLSEDGERLFVANRRAGSLSVVDVEQRTVVAEHDFGGQWSDLLALDAKRLLATDEAGHELVVIDTAGAEPRVSQRLKVASYPVGVTATRDGRRSVVASLWSRRLTFVSCPPDAPARVTGTLDLPFAPRKQLFVRDDSRLIVADAFGGRLAIIDPAEPKLLHVRPFPAHNIRGLATTHDGRMLVVAHQMLNELAHANRNDVHWGLLMSNDLRWLRLDNVLDPSIDLYKGAHMHPVGEVNNGGADPSTLVMTRDGRVVVGMAGIGEIAVGREKDFSLQKIQVGKRPVAIAVDAASRFAYVANMFADSLAVVDLSERETVARISLGPRAELAVADQGELLFYDARLAHDGWMSCHSCHTDGHTNGLTNDNQSDQSFGAPKRVLSLLSPLRQTAPYAWNGRVADLKTQVTNSLVKTMQTDDEVDGKQVDALVAYLHTLSAPPSVESARGVLDRPAIARGQRLFSAKGCQECHAPPTYTTPETYDVGLKDNQGNKQFNPPSLLGVGQRGPYFHENQAATLEDVFRKFRHGNHDFTDDELRDLTTFLRSL